MSRATARLIALGKLRGRTERPSRNFPRAALRSGAPWRPRAEELVGGDVEEARKQKLERHANSTVAGPSRFRARESRFGSVLKHVEGGSYDSRPIQPLDVEVSRRSCS